MKALLQAKTLFGAGRAIRRSMLAVAILGVAASCSKAPSPPKTLMPDVIYHGGKIVTVNERFDIVQALAVREGKIIAVGTDAEVRALAGPETRLVDFKGQTVLPGFNDTHVHFWQSGFNEPAHDPIRFDYRHIKSLPELQAALGNTVAKVPAGQWIVGSISEVPFAEENLFTRKDIDKVSGDHPVAFRRGPHIWVVNSKALQLAKITGDTPQPSGGVIAKDETGLPTGVLRESNAQRLVGVLIPPAPDLDDATAESHLHRQMQLLLALGITSGNVAGLRPGQDFRNAQSVYKKWGRELPRMTLQLRVRPGFDAYDDLAMSIKDAKAEIDAMSIYTGFGSDRLKIGAIKMSVDGAFTGQAAAVLVPYADGRTGSVRIPQDALYEVAKYAHDRGWQIGVHAIGDAAVKLYVDVLERVLRESPRANHRHYVHHASVKTPDETIKKMADLGIMVSSQPNFTFDLSSYYTSALSGMRLQTNNPQRSFMDAGVRVAYGSDHRPYGPIIAIWAAVVRQGRTGGIYGLKDEGVTLEEAIRNHTVNSAYLTFDENERGSLEPGKLADMVVLTEDIMTVNPNRIRDIGIVQTIIGGEVVYTAKDRPLVARFDDGEIWYARQIGANDTASLVEKTRSETADREMLVAMQRISREQAPGADCDAHLEPY